MTLHCIRTLPFPSGRNKAESDLLESRGLVHQSMPEMHRSIDSIIHFVAGTILIGIFRCHKCPVQFLLCQVCGEYAHNLVG